MDRMDKLYNMKLGEVFTINDQKWLRVPGGWICSLGFHDMTSTFVPFHNEFQKKSNGSNVGVIKRDF